MLNCRSDKNELLDGDNIPAADLFQNLRELDTINTLLGGYKISLSALNTVIKNNKPYTLVDIGCGGGDTLKYIFNWNKRANKNLSLVGIDIKPVCIEYAKTNTSALAIRYICDDYKCLYEHERNVDIIHASLFCHHLTEEQLVELVSFALTHKAILIVNDLERNPIAYYSIKWLTQLFSKSYLVKNDAPLSVARGFKKKEWETILDKAGATHFSLKNKWAFRHQVIVYGNQ
ncbi:methyltransferase domain-containing protein [Cytophaga aurantiaca]|uniref:methyltransferase domain-containing protein n=1 Tax=Cytophaga aurantiaca TaxID=29530 RepID=UPI000365B6CC|nr:methyltransferase domain-containing protein [Cytophaga aurantiaca]